MERSIETPSLRSWLLTACISIPIDDEVDRLVHTERRILMIRTAMVRNLVAVAAITLVSVSVSGCDYWPPALQTQIEQLRSELQSATMEKAQFQSQLTSMAKVKDDLQMQVNDLSRASQDKSTMIASLQNGLAAAQERLAKSAKVTASKVAAVKPSIKATPKHVTHKAPQKASVKKKAPAKTTSKH
jgi:septal ring factor EnvC (AmiA/AmiB activator)